MNPCSSHALAAALGIARLALLETRRQRRLAIADLVRAAEAERGMVSNESIRRWMLKFGPAIAKNLREPRQEILDISVA
jgi:hypothetical protein